MEDLRRLDIRLPADHPIFTVPARQRGAVAREWMDVGNKLNQIEARIMARFDYLTREINEIKNKQVVVGQEGKGLAVIIEDPLCKEVASDEFKIPTEIINAFDGWGAGK